MFYAFVSLSSWSCSSDGWGRVFELILDVGRLCGILKFLGSGCGMEGRCLNKCKEPFSLDFGRQEMYLD